MKKIVITILAAAAVLTGCKKEKIEGSETGTLELSLSKDNAGYNDKIDGPSPKAAASGVDINSFKVTVASIGGGSYSNTWVYSEMPDMIDLPSGNYNVTAVSPEDHQTAAWDKPLYGGEKDIIVTPGKVSPVEVVCGLTNMKVTVKCTENFLAEIERFKITVAEASAETNCLIWEKTEVDEGKSGYFPVKPLIVKVDGYRTIDGTGANTTITIKDVAARDHHILNIDAITTGQIAPDNNGLIVIDPDTTDKDVTVDVPGFENPPVDRPEKPQPEEPETPAVTMTWEANPDFGVTELQEDMSSAVIGIAAPAGIRSFKVTVDSPTLNSFIVGMTADKTTTMDLINDTKLNETLGMVAATLPTGDRLANQKNVNFDLSSLLPMIIALSPESDTNHNFTLEVSDNNGKSLSKTLTFHYTGTPAAL